MQWVCSWLDLVPPSQAALHEQRGASVILDLGPDLVYHRKMLQDCWLECRAAVGCAAPSCLWVRMFEDVYLFPFIHFFAYHEFTYHVAWTL